MRHRRPERVAWTWIALAVLTGASAGCGRSGDATGATPPPPLVGVVEARRMTVPMLASPNGTTRALKQVAVRARVRGFLQEIHFEEGADVKAGQLLFVIEEDPFRAKLASAEAGLAEAEAALAKARESKIREIATAQLALDQALLLLARIEETRTRTLAGRGAAPREELDQADANWKKAQAQVDSSKANLEQSRADYDVNIQSARAKVASAEADVTQARIDLSYCRMSAPIDGRIGEAKVKVGNLVGTGEGGTVSAALGGAQYTELATIQQLDPMGVDVQASSRYLVRATELIRDGLAIRLIRPALDGPREHPQVGKAFFIDNAIDPNSSTFLVKGEVPNPAKDLLPGEYVKVNMTVGEHKDAIVVPEQAVLEGQVGPTVYVVGPGDEVAVVRVKPVDTYQGMRVLESDSGLEPGRRVVVEGLQLVRPGMKVRVEPASAGAPETPALSGR